MAGLFFNFCGLDFPSNLAVFSNKSVLYYTLANNFCHWW